MSSIINNLANYQGGIVPNVKQQKMQRQDSDAAKSRCRPKKKRATSSKKAVSVFVISFIVTLDISTYGEILLFNNYMNVF